MRSLFLIGIDNSDIFAGMGGSLYLLCDAKDPTQVKIRYYHGGLSAIIDSNPEIPLGGIE